MTEPKKDKKELDGDQLDQAVGGAGVVVHDAARKQEQGDKLVSEEKSK